MNIRDIKPGVTYVGGNALSSRLVLSIEEDGRVCYSMGVLTLAPVFMHVSEFAEWAVSEYMDDATKIEMLCLALQPFADCCEQIGDEESNEEWAKFRLLIKNYRKAREAIRAAGSIIGG